MICAEKIVMPEGMMKAAVDAAYYPGRFKCPGEDRAVERIIEAALRWLVPYVDREGWQAARALIARGQSE